MQQSSGCLPGRTDAWCIQWLPDETARWQLPDLFIQQAYSPSIITANRALFILPLWWFCLVSSHSCVWQVFSPINIIETLKLPIMWKIYIYIYVFNIRKCIFFPCFSECLAFFCAKMQCEVLLLLSKYYVRFGVLIMVWAALDFCSNIPYFGERVDSSHVWWKTSPLGQV